jgi:uncharacterized protein YbjQ (UPF0145 family)
MFRFLHSSDLHLGKRFGNFSGDLPSRLREARHATIARLAQQARDNGAGAILLAGDTFDTETPAPDIRRQALAEMAHHTAVRWVLLPGNHDSLQASQLWDLLAAEAPANVTLATEPRPITLSPGVVLLPAPCTTRRPGRDLTDWMTDEPTPEGAIRIGLAHGPIRDFSEDGAAIDVIAPDRARRSGLAYLALGDWHGALEVDPLTRYCGSPEPDRFKHDRPGEALLIDLAGASAMPTATPLPTASFAWHSLSLHLLDGDDPVARLQAILPAARERRQTLVRILTTGRSRISGRTALDAAIEQAAPDFAHLEQDGSGLATECDIEDLDQIDRAGALREAANTLLAEARDGSRSAADRDVSWKALTRLYSYAHEIAR